MLPAVQTVDKDQEEAMRRGLKVATERNFLCSKAGAGDDGGDAGERGGGQEARPSHSASRMDVSSMAFSEEKSFNLWGLIRA